MKKTTTILFTLLLALGAMAQDGMGGFGFHVGYASPTLRINSPSSKQLEAVPMSGIKAGFCYDATIAKGFGTTLGLNYTFGTYRSKWETVNTGYSTQETSYRDTYHGLELFCDWQYKFEIAGNTYLMLYTGPTIQVHLSLQEQEYIREGSSTTRQTRYGYDYRDNESFEDYKRVNVTWGIGAGFQYKRYFIRGGYDFGLFNPYKKSTFSEMGIASELYTRGRFDQWQIKIGMYIWQN
jgi:hypothetical protein